MGFLDIFKEWQSDRRERRIEKLTAKAAHLDENQQYDLLFLHEGGFIRAKGSGQSITKIYAELENLIRKKLHVVVKPGTYFVSSGGHQNMATNKKYTLTLYPCSTQQIEISATCINADRPIPGKGDRFYGVARVSDEVARFLEATNNEDPMVVQAGVWTLTDNYSRYDVISRLISKDESGNSWHPVTHEHCDRAKAILEQLGIAHNLWHSNISYEKKSIVYENGDKYIGEFRYGKYHGQGKLTFKDGGSIEGNWKDGLLHGHGKKILEGFVWEGEYEDNSIKKGILTWPDGKKYVGQFERGQPHGKGQFKCPNGSPLEGEWRNSTLLVTGLIGGHDLNTKFIEKFDGTKENGGWLHLTDGTKIWISTNSEGQWEMTD